ncbi:hypothetical protein NC652_004094 [Populus alba x Populus x berolinensis]|nr:hypothetical protein NC652_004094 [Populus alba x Populus x berolinensis]
MEKASLKLLFVFVLVFSMTCFPEGAEALGYCSSDSDCPSRCPAGCTDAHCQYVAEGDFECYCGLNPCLG